MLGEVGRLDLLFLLVGRLDVTLLILEIIAATATEGRHGGLYRRGEDTRTTVDKAVHSAMNGLTRQQRGQLTRWTTEAELDATGTRERQDWAMSDWSVAMRSDWQWTQTVAVLYMSLCSVGRGYSSMVIG